MKFLVELSDEGDTDKPCPEAVKVTGVGYPYKQNWQIELNTLEDLIKFIERQNEGIILFPPTKTSFRSFDGESWAIEIYNGYRE